MFLFRVTFIVFMAIYFSAAHAQSSQDNNFRTFSNWINDRFHLQTGTNAIPSSNCRISIQNYPDFLNIIVQRGSEIATFATQINTSQLLIIATDALRADLFEPNCGREGCGKLFIDDSALDIEDTRFERTKIYCTLK